MITVFQGALTFIMRNLRKIQKQKSVNSIGDPEIPQLVFEELLVNALIHRDYFVSSTIRLFVFMDRIEIISPGHLPNHLTVEKILSGTSIARNPILTSFIAKGILPYRGLGTGIRRALKQWPQIQFIDDRDGLTFKTIVQRVEVENVITRLLKKTAGGPINGPINGLELEILETVIDNPTISYDNLARLLQKGRTSIKRSVKQLKSQGILKRLGSKKNGHWVVKTENLTTNST
jgi:ATP-dependent DNA helicase RecG